MGAEPASRQSGKRLRVTRRDRARASPGSTFTDPTSVSGALEFDLTQLDSELEGPLPPAEALVEPTRESESDMESVRVVPRRRLVLQFARDEDGNNGSGDEHQRSQAVEEELNEDLLFTPQTRAMSNGFEGLDEVSLGDVFEVRAQVMKTVPNFMKGVFRGGLKMSLEEILKGRARSDSVKEIRGWKLASQLLLDRGQKVGFFNGQRPKSSGKSTKDSSNNRKQQQQQQHHKQQQTAKAAAKATRTARKTAHNKKRQHQVTAKRWQTQHKKQQKQYKHLGRSIAARVGSFNGRRKEARMRGAKPRKIRCGWGEEGGGNSVGYRQILSQLVEVKGFQSIVKNVIDILEGQTLQQPAATGTQATRKQTAQTQKK